MFHHGCRGGCRGGRPRAGEAGGSAAQLQPRHPADPLEQLLRLPRARRETARNQVPFRHQGRRLRRGRHHRPGERRQERAGQEDHRAGSGRADAAARFRARADRQADRAPPPLDRRRREVGHALGLCVAGASGAAGAGPALVGQQSDRPVHPLPTRARGHAAGAGGRQGHSASPRHLRPDGPPAHAGGDRRVSRRQVAERLRDPGRCAAPVTPLRRAHGDAVARCRALRRHPRLPHRQPPRHVALARLGHQCVQPQHAVRSIHGRTAGGRSAAERDARAEGRLGLQPQPHDQFRRGRDRRGVSGRVRHRPRRGDVIHLHGIDDGMRAVPYAQVRPDHAQGVLPVLRVLQQRSRVRARRQNGERRAAAPAADARAADAARGDRVGDQSS